MISNPNVTTCSCGEQIIRFRFIDGHKWYHMDDAGIPLPKSPACVDPDAG